jgi:hypothetical protein
VTAEKIATLRAMKISSIRAAYTAGAWTPVQASWARAEFANLRWCEKNGE